MQRIVLENQGDGWWGSEPTLRGTIIAPATPCFGDELLKYYLVELNPPLLDEGRGTGIANRLLVMASRHYSLEEEREGFSVPAFPIDVSTPAVQRRFTFADTWSGAKVTVRLVDT